MYRVVKRLKGLKTPFRKLLHDHGNLYNRVNLLLIDLDEVHKAIDKGPFSSAFREENAPYLTSLRKPKLMRKYFWSKTLRLIGYKLG